MTESVLSDRIEVSVRNKTYGFRIPGITYDVEVGYRAAAIRRAAAPESGGQVGAIDWQAVQFSRYLAIMELYLETADEPWPFTPDKGGKPHVDSSKFPVGKTAVVYEIGQAFEAAYDRFRDDGIADGQPAGAEAVAGGANPGTP